jgi:hypothetical protein
MRTLNLVPELPSEHPAKHPAKHPSESRQRQRRPTASVFRLLPRSLDDPARQADALVGDILANCPDARGEWILAKDIEAQYRELAARSGWPVLTWCAISRALARIGDKREIRRRSCYGDDDEDHFQTFNHNGFECRWPCDAEAFASPEHTAFIPASQSRCTFGSLAAARNSVCLAA